MRRVRRRDTSAEMRVRSAVHGLGLRYYVDRAPVKGHRRKADLVFPRAKLAVFVDGCFWHGCPEHMTWPQNNSRWWREKIERNVARDRDTDAKLAAAGWRSARFWEHDDPHSVARRIADLLENGP